MGWARHALLQHQKLAAQNISWDVENCVFLCCSRREHARCCHLSSVFTALSVSQFLTPFSLAHQRVLTLSPFMGHRAVATLPVWEIGY